MTNFKNTTKGYNGHKNYAQWNQWLWINNDESLYRLAKDFISFERSKDDAAKFMLENLQCLGEEVTPDGVKWSKTGIRAAMVGM